MKKILFIFGLLTTLSAFAQQPNWYDANQRAVTYPKGSYFTGIAYGEVRSNESAGAAMERLKVAARTEAVSTISVQVKNETELHTHDESFQSIDAWSETIRETYDSKTITSVNLEIPGLQVEAWKNPSSNEVVAFAYIKKSTLARQMDKQVTAGLTRIETILENTEQLIAQGQKLEARENIKKAIPYFQEVEQAQRVLIVADPMSDAESLQLAETKKLQQSYMRLVAQLKNGINLYIKCTAKLTDGSNYPTLLNEIKGALSPVGCTFVTNPAEADWIATVDVTAREYNALTMGQSTSYFTYVEAAVSIKKGTTGQVVYEDAISVKGSHTRNYVEAARAGYKEISPKISNLIKQQITK